MKGVQPLSVVDNSDLCPSSLTALVTRLMLASEASSPSSQFQVARFRMALQVFVFLLVVCLLLSLARLGRLDRFHRQPSPSREKAKRHTLHRSLCPARQTIAPPVDSPPLPRQEESRRLCLCVPGLK